MDRLRVGTGIFIMIMALGSCATGIQVSTLPELPTQAEAVSEEESPETSFAAPPLMREPEGRDGPPESPELERLASPVPPPQISVATRTPSRERVTSTEVAAPSPTIEPTIEPAFESEPSASETTAPAVTTQPSAATTATPQASEADPAPAVPQTREASPAPAAPIAVTDSRPSGPSDSDTIARESASDARSPVSSSGGAGPPVETAPAQSAPTVSTLQTPTATAAPPASNASPSPAAGIISEPQPAFSGPLDEVIVELPGEGWTYVGAEQSSGEVRLRRKRTRGGNSIFSFEMSKAGEYTLWFQRQDSRTGRFHNETLSVRATDSLPDARSAIQHGTTDGGASPTDGASEDPLLADYSLPLEVIAEGDLPRGVRLLLDVSDKHDPGLDHLDARHIATLMGRAVELPADLQQELLARVADSASEEAPTARSALLDVSIAREDPEAALAASNGLILAGEAQPAQLLDAANLVARTGNHEEAVGLALTALGEDVSPELLARHLDDEALFLHARRLEALGPDRDLRKALAFYETIVNDFPLSSRWEESRARVSHLKRHYFDVR